MTERTAGPGPPQRYPVERVRAWVIALLTHVPPDLWPQPPDPDRGEDVSIERLRGYVKVTAREDGAKLRAWAWCKGDAQSWSRVCADAGWNRDTGRRRVEHILAGVTGLLNLTDETRAAMRPTLAPTKP